jgi:hypothetical protein
MLPLAVEISRSWLLCAGLGVVAAIVLIAVGRKRAEHHKWAQQAAALLREWGLGLLADLLDAYAIDDFRGIITAAKAIIDTLKDPAKRELAFTTFMAMLLKAKFTNPESRDAAIKFVDDLKATTAPGGLTAANLQQDVKDLVGLLKTKPQIALQPPDPPAPAATDASAGMTVTATNALPGHVITVAATPGSPAAAAAASS